eukprot:UC1_evm3s1508
MASAKKEKKVLTPEEMTVEFAKITAKTIDEQANAFLRAFVADFSGNFEEVLDLAEEFKKYAPEDEGDGVRELEEDKAHLFLERRGETMTVKDLRDALKEIDLDKNHRVSFVEYCLFNYKKTLAEFFEEKEGDMAALLAALEEAIKAYQATLAEKKARQEKMDKLEADAAGGGVKGMRAKAELEAMKNEDELERNRREITAGAKQRKAKKDLENGDPFAEEQKRVAAEKKKKEEEDAKAKAESRRRLSEKAKLWN